MYICDGTSRGHHVGASDIFIYIYIYVYMYCMCVLQCFAYVCCMCFLHVCVALCRSEFAPTASRLASQRMGCMCVLQRVAVCCMCALHVCVAFMLQ